MTAGAIESALEPGGPPPGDPEAGAAAIEGRSPLNLFWRRFRSDKVAMGALAFIVLLVLVAIFAGPLSKIAGGPGPYAQNSHALDSFGVPTGPSGKYPFGVDQLGRDVYARTLYGTRVSLEVAFFATAISVVIGTILGLVAGYFRGALDTLISRLLDVALSFPVLLLGLGLGASCSGNNGCFGGLVKPGVPVIIFVIAFAYSPYFARLVRGQVLSLREREFVEAARSLGASSSRIIFRELLPNIVAPIIVYATLLIPTNILFEAALSFLGVGVQPPTASWGQMISDAQPIFDAAPWYMLAPGIALVLTVLAFNLVGDGLQDALNPKTATK